MTRPATIPAAALIILLSLVDWAMTVDGLALGICTEANPVGRWMLGQGLGPSLAIKLSVTALGVAVLVTLSSRRWARVGLYLLAGLYVALVVYQAAARVVCL